MKTRLIAVLVDLLLDCFCALLVPAERSPGLPASAEQGQFTRHGSHVGGNHA